MEEKYILQTEDGISSCGDIGITTEQWIALLEKKNDINVLTALTAFLRSPEHGCSCAGATEDYGLSTDFYNNNVWRFGQYAQKQLNRFACVDEDGNPKYWPIPIERGYYDKKHRFVFVLRPELVAALRHVLMHKLLDEFCNIYAGKSLDEDLDELYKWKFIDKAEGLSPIEVVELINKDNGFNLVYRTNVVPSYKYYIANTRDEFVGLLNDLADESHDLDKRVEDFKEGIKAMYKGDQNAFGNDERSISAILTCLYPEKYTYYKDEVYKLMCDYLGYERQKQAGKKFSHFMQIIREVDGMVGEEANKMLAEELANVKHRPSLLSIQNLFWCMRDYTTNSTAKKIDPNNMLTRYNKIIDILKNRKNIVFYGAPGTGKTYNIPAYVVGLCDPSFDFLKATRADIMARYEELKKQKRVSFTTFHQSMDYEDWMEGLRPKVDETTKQVSYDVEPGIFKLLCEEADKPIVKKHDIGIATDATIWKVSLGGTGKNPIRTDCMANNRIRIGWDRYGETIDENTDWSLHDGEGKNILHAFIDDMQIGDIVMSCFSNKTIDAIGVVTGDYEWNDSLSEYKRTRSVKWLIKDVDENIVDINGGKVMTLGTVYRLNSVSMDSVKTILTKYKQDEVLETNEQPYVMVIDEMNRGNVSKIFGELITLLEVDKRKGEEDAESVRLPYSKTSFSIPKNVYIIATMNTADRSLGTLDYAIRRRFSFIPCKPHAIEDIRFDEELFGKVSRLFIANYDEYSKAANEDTRLIAADTLSEEYRPEDVWVGHSYFIFKTEDDKRHSIMYDIIPLLEEYMRDGVLKDDTNVKTVIDELYKEATE